VSPLVVLGATGFVGRHVLTRARTDWAAPIVAVGRRGREEVAPIVAVQGDICDVAALVATLPPGAVIVNAAYAPSASAAENLALAEAVVDLATRTRAAGLVHLSTAVVVGPRAPRRVDEDTPCRPVTTYQRTKLEIERRLAARLSGVCPLVILRPTAVFGDGGANLRKLVADLRSRPAIENYARACLFGRRPMNLVPVETVAAAVLFAASRCERAAPVWIVSDDDAEGNDFRGVECAIRHALPSRAHALPVVPLPRVLLSMAQRMTGRRTLPVDVRFSAARLTAAGFVAPVTFPEALARYAKAAASAARSIVVEATR
jgi:nucleoside-diphosphate-sugar epimerase